MNKFPNYIIAGVMKSGTTVLQDFICLHPDVRTPKIKEINYFSLFSSLGDEWYLEHFGGDQTKIIGEASPSYFDMCSSNNIPKLIKTKNQDIKIILIYFLKSNCSNINFIIFNT